MRSYDHEGLVAEHFIHANDIIAGLITVMFNRAMSEGFPDTWSTSTIVPIFKSGDPMIPGNYRTTMVGQTLAKLYASILEQQLSRWTEKTGRRALGQTQRECNYLRHFFVFINTFLFNKTCLVSSKFNVHIRNRN